MWLAALGLVLVSASPNSVDVSSAAPGRCVPAPFSASLRTRLAELTRDSAPDGSGLPRSGRRDAELLRAFVRLEPDLAPWAFLSVAPWLAEDACARRLLGPMLERRAGACRGEDCRSLNGLVFRDDLIRAIEHDWPSRKATDPLRAGSFTPVWRFSLKVTEAGDAGLRVRVVSSTEDGGLRLHADTTRVDAAAQVMGARDTLELPVTDGDAPTTFGAAGGLQTWRSREPLQPGAALAACADGALRPLGRFLGVRAVWQGFPDGWTRQFEYQLPCAATFVVPAVGGVRPGPWRAFPLGAGAAGPDLDPGPPYAAGTRVRRFGHARYRETVEGGVVSVYGKRCLIEATVKGARRSTALTSPYGCQLSFAADFNADGLADFVVHMGGGSCEHEFLFVSGPGGWERVAEEGGCE
ncbi:MAG: hypothetical protein INH41_17505 [Myxococcaceae bacterium]|nr:hypothetical protein [Myxococcaceae bacterium]MCA3014181.1 hypothetical protein [Myxococcaceae bacterium]